MSRAAFVARLAGLARLGDAVRFVASGALDLLHPFRCLVCGATDRPSRVPGLCPSCALALPWRRRADEEHSPLEVGHDRFTTVVVALRFEPPVDELVYQLKYGGARTAALPLADALARSVELEPPAPRPELLVPVPMHWTKRWVRGLDHAAAIAEELGRTLRLPTVPALRRRRATVAQGQARSARQRVTQVGDAIALARPRAIRGRHVGLVDDVVTSGATATACADELRRAGARSVTLLAVAGNG
jgi:ComF family protein